MDSHPEAAARHWLPKKRFDQLWETLMSVIRAEHYLVSIRVAECRRLLRPQRLLVLSTPNRNTDNDARRAEPNPFHRHEFDLCELRDEVKEFFPALEILGQSRTEGVLSRRGTIDDATALPLRVDANGPGEEKVELEEWLHRVESSRLDSTSDNRFLQCVAPSFMPNGT